MKRALLTFVLAGIMALVVTSVVAARSDKANGPKGDPGAKGKCVKECKAERRECRNAQKSSRATCTEPCAALRAAAVAVCGEEVGLEESPECLAAQQALRDCVRPCRKAYRAEKRECRIKGRECLAEECGARQGKGYCVSACRQERRACMLDPREARHACFRECQALHSAAAAACGDEEISEGEIDEAGAEDGANESPECLAAEAALNACTTPCREAFKAARTACREVDNQCLTDECGVTRARLRTEGESAD